MVGTALGKELSSCQPTSLFSWRLHPSGVNSIHNTPRKHSVEGNYHKVVREEKERCADEGLQGPWALELKSEEWEGTGHIKMGEEQLAGRIARAKTLKGGQN